MKTLKLLSILLFIGIQISQAQDVDENWEAFAGPNNLANLHFQDNLIYATHEGGISIINPNNHKLQNITVANSDLLSHRITGSHLDEKGRLFLTNNSNFVEVLDGNNVIRFNTNDEVFSNNFSASKRILADSKGNVYFIAIDTTDNKNTYSLDFINEDLERKTTFNADDIVYIRDFIIDQEDNFYLKNNEKVYRYKDGIIDLIFTKANNESIGFMGISPENDFYLTYHKRETFSDYNENFLLKISQDTMIEYAILDPPEIEGKPIRKMMIDEQGKIWLSSEDGMIIFENGAFSFLSNKDILDQEPYSLLAFIARDSLVWMYDKFDRQTPLKAYHNSQIVAKHRLTPTHFVYNNFNEIGLNPTGGVVITSGGLEYVHEYENEQWILSQNALSTSNRIHVMAVDESTGRVWYGGPDFDDHDLVSIKHYENNEWHNHLIPYNSPPFTSYTVQSLFAKNGKVYVSGSTDKSLFHVFDGEQWEEEAVFRGNHSIFHITDNSFNDSILISSTKGLFSYHNKDINFIDLDDSSPDVPFIYWSGIDPKGRLIYSTSCEMIRVGDPLPEIPEEFGVTCISGFVFDENGHYWGGTNNGLISLQNEEWFLYNSGKEPAYIRRVLIDEQNNKWMTDHTGVSVFNEHGLNNVGSSSPMPTTDGYTIFPNPASDFIILKFDKNNTIGNFALYNNLGQRLIYHTQLNLRNEISVSSLPAGTYFYTIDGTVISKGKIIVF